MEIQLVRHPKVALGAGICYGWSDVALAPDYPEEIERIRAKLAPSRPRVCYSSPLRRCAQVARELGGEVRFDPALKELHFGDWELRPWSAIDPVESSAWAADFVSRRCPNGESYGELHARVTGFWERLVSDEPADAVVVTHGGVIRSILAGILKIPLVSSFALQLDCGGVSKVTGTREFPSVAYVNR